MKFKIEKTVGYLFPEKISLFKNKEDAFKYYPYSHEKVIFICPCCGEEKEMTIDNAVHKKFFCAKCSDKISMPNKMLRNINYQLKDLGILEDFDLEYIIPNTGTAYRFDAHFFYKNIDYYIEAHGVQHKDERSFHKTGIKTKKRDKEKVKLVNSLQNSELKIVWCDEDNFDYRKNNFIEQYKQIGIDLNKIDWLQVEKSLASNLIIEVCNYYNEHNDIPLYKIAEEFKISYPLVTKYLKRGTKIGVCDFDTHAHKSKMSSKRIQGQKVLVYNSDKKLIYIFSCQTETAKELSKIYNKKFLRPSITKAINENRRYNTLIFRNFDNPIQKGEILPFERIPKNSKGILVYKDNKLVHEFISCGECAREMEKIYKENFEHSLISVVTKNKTYYYKGFYFVSTNDEILPKFERVKAVRSNIKEILVYNKEGELIHRFNNQVETVEKMKELYHKDFTTFGVNSCVNKKIKFHLDFIFRKIDEPLTKEEYENLKVIKYKKHRKSRKSNNI